MIFSHNIWFKSGSPCQMVQQLLGAWAETLILYKGNQRNGEDVSFQLITAWRLIRERKRIICGQPWATGRTFLGCGGDWSPPAMGLQREPCSFILHFFSFSHLQLKLRQLGSKKRYPQRISVVVMCQGVFTQIFRGFLMFWKGWILLWPLVKLPRFSVAFPSPSWWIIMFTQIIHHRLEIK